MDTARDDNQGMGSGRTGVQERGGFGAGGDDSYGTSGTSGRGYGEERTTGTSGGLGSDDTYGGSGTTGGVSTGRDTNQGMGAGRTGQQERGGFGVGGDDSYDTSRGGAVSPQHKIAMVLRH